MEDWTRPGNSYGSYFDSQSVALGSVGFKNPNAIFNAQQNPQVAKQCAEAISLMMMGVLGREPIKVFDPELGLSYNLLHPRCKMTYAEGAHWLEYQRRVQALPFSSPGWISILVQRRSDTYLDLSQVIKKKGKDYYWSRSWRGDVLVPASDHFSHDQFVAALVFPEDYIGDGDTIWIKQKPEGESAFAQELNATPLSIGQWFLPLEIRMILLLKGYRLLREDEVSSKPDSHPSYSADDGRGGLVVLQTGYHVPKDEKVCGGYALGKWLGELTSCPDCSDGLESEFCFCPTCKGTSKLVLNQPALKPE